MRLFVEEADGFELALATYSRADQADRLIESLVADLAEAGLSVLRVDLRHTPADMVLLTCITDALAAAAARGEAVSCLFVTGLERHLDYLHGGTRPASTGLLATANLQREAFPQRCPIPLVLWTSTLAHPAIAHQAPDLWHWRWASFDFTDPDEPRTRALDREIPRPKRGFDRLPIEDQKRRLAMLDALIADLGDDPAALSNRDRAWLTRLILERGEALFAVGEVDAANDAFDTGLSLAQGSADEPLVARAWAGKADVLRLQGQFDEALRILKEELLPVYDRLGDVRERAFTWGRIADILYRRGQLDEALRIRHQEELPVYDRLGDVHSRAVTWGQIADILYRRGELDEALRIRHQEQLPVYDRLGDVRSRAVTWGKIADILFQRGELDEALRIRHQEQLPVYDRLGDVRSRAVTWGKIADILYRRGELDEALRIRHQEQLPVFDRLGDVRERAVTWGKIADILFQRGELDEALRIRHQEELPVYDRLGDVRERAVTWGRIADILFQRGELDEALRIRHQEQLPVYDRLGDVRSRAVTWGKIADILFQRGELDEALRIRHQEQLPVYDRLGDVRGRAVTWGRIADILFQRGELDEALRIRHQEQLPVFDRLGDVRERAVVLTKIARIDEEQGGLADSRRDRILAHLHEARTIVQRLKAANDQGWIECHLARVLGQLGHRDEATATLASAEAAFRSNGNKDGLAWMARVREQLDRVAETNQAEP